jgi:hypothetical protein
MKPKPFFIVFFMLCITLFSSCRKFVYDNPLDPDYTLKPPKNLTVTAITTTSATLQWKEENNYS